MEHDTDHKLPENNPFYVEPEVESVPCSCCGENLNKYESEDPIVIDGRTFCDLCADKMVHLRLAGFIKPVSEKTTELVTNNWLRKESETMQDFRDIVNNL